MKSMGRALAAGVLGGALALTTACSGGSGSGGTGGGSGSGGAKSPSASKSAVSAAVVSIAPANGATDVKPSGALKVSVASGKLSTVTVTDKDGKPVAGSISADGASWLPTGNLSVGMQYQVSAQAADANGVVAASTSTFTTLTPTKDANPHGNVTDGETVGVGMIVSLSFDHDVKDKAAVLQGVTFDTPGNIPVKGHWFGSRRVDFRPEQYWPANSKVTVHYRLKSVEVAPGIYGGVDADRQFTIGRSQISTVDASTHEMSVVRNGQPYETIPISTGASQPKSWNAYNGTMVIEAKEGTATMDSSTVPGLQGAAYKEKVPHSLRLTDSGTYVHGNNWSSHSVFGNTNVSHGCVGLEDAPGDAGSESSSAGKYYADAMVGDVVTIKNSVGEQVSPDNGLSGWNINWANW
ncbi:Ig-like domain-containing protein [Kitasatospora sp. MAP5-34]|uniref:L,D-transpeptidase n=1 Tax=Kitasatospora sp. MAP5-34 TaxID=3035102 RepID=UPI0024771CE9|nr:Ig-like domain-containing protein [Kitasatospora sp. MAP5-34]MDH6575723.1 lipoprotein-anchoring transpeptidase ErfK/SrfK [Kitasatospora sp. MAP5-34]